MAVKPFIGDMIQLRWNDCPRRMRALGFSLYITNQEHTHECKTTFQNRRSLGHLRKPWRLRYSTPTRPIPVLEVPRWQQLRRRGSRSPSGWRSRLHDRHGDWKLRRNRSRCSDGSHGRQQHGLPLILKNLAHMRESPQQKEAR